MKFPSESEIRAKYFLNTQIPKSGLKKWLNPQSAAIGRSTNPAWKLRSESEIWAKIFSKSADPLAYSSANELLWDSGYV